jgi:hypothetical protein
MDTGANFQKMGTGACPAHPLIHEKPWVQINSTQIVSTLSTRTDGMQYRSSLQVENFLAGLMISVHHYAHTLVELVVVLRLVGILSWKAGCSNELFRNQMAQRIPGLRRQGSYEQCKLPLHVHNSTYDKVYTRTTP